MSEIIRVRCGGCDVKIKAPLKYQGRKVNCPQCGHEVIIPKSATARTAATPGSASSKAVSPVIIPSTTKATSSRRVAAKPVIIEEEQPMELGDDAFVDEKPRTRTRARSSAATDDFADLDDYGDIEDYGDPDDYGTPAQPRSRTRSSSPSRKKRRKKKPKKGSSGGGSGIDAGILGGIGMMAIAAIWLVAGLMNGYLFYYPIGLFFIGIIAFVKGLIG